MLSAYECQLGLEVVIEYGVRSTQPYGESVDLGSGQ